LSGSYKILCYNEDGESDYTVSIAASSGTSTILDALKVQETCRLYEKIDVIDVGNYYSATSGKDFIIRFKGINANMGQFMIVSDPDDPINYGG
jgi:hypothetical protein